MHAATWGNDPIETSLISTKAVNALLTALDRLRNHPNVVVLCTSNLIKAIVSVAMFYETKF